MSAADRERIAAICASLDGVALAIELAAARLPAVGVDGLESGLSEPLRMLTGGRPADDRHRSLRSALDWSYALLSDADQALLRRVSVFAAPFTVEAACAVVGDWPPIESAAVIAGLAGLVDQSLLAVVNDATGTCYRALETIRQYGAELLAAEGEGQQASARHLSWALDAGPQLLAEAERETAGWRTDFDYVADDLRNALTWALGQPGSEMAAYRLATTLAELTFMRGMPGESQHRYEQAAGCIDDDALVALALRRAAGAALSRHVGEDAQRLFRSSADAALRAGDRAGAARDLAKASEMLIRGPGMLGQAASAGLADRLLAEASPLAEGDLAARAQLLLARAFRMPDLDPECAAVTSRALELAHRAGEPLLESAALDQETGIQLASGTLKLAAATALRRTRLLAPLPARVENGMELSDALHMAAECAMAMGDLAGARKLAEQSCELPFHREEAHLATSRLILVTALAGDWDETVTLGAQFLDGWERAGRPRAGNHGVSAYAVAAVHGLRGDEAARAEWLGVVEGLKTPGRPFSEQHYDEFFDALLLLHQGLAERAVQRLSPAPEELQTWFNARWKPWYSALWAEAAVLSQRADAGARIGRARAFTRENPVADAVVTRAAGLLSGDAEALQAAAAALRAAGCRYQWARTLVLAGGRDEAQGRALLSSLGATPMPRTARRARRMSSR